MGPLNISNENGQQDLQLTKKRKQPQESRRFFVVCPIS
mgnify:CR=1 FL=1